MTYGAATRWSSMEPVPPTRGNLGKATTPGTGCGVVLGNITDQTAAACERLGHAVAHAYHDATLPAGQPGGIRFTRISSLDAAPQTSRSQ